MAIKKMRINQRNASNNYDVLHPETSADMVIDTETGKTVAAHLADYTQHVEDEAHVRWLGTAGGSANALTATHNEIDSFKDGLGVSFAVGADSTGETTLNINGLGAIPIKSADGKPFKKLIAGSVYTLRFNGGNFFLQGNEGGGEVTHGERVYEIPGTFTFEVPDGVSTIMARIWGAGGGGGGNSQSGGDGGGGGSGAFLMVNIPVVSGQKLPVVVGMGGNAGVLDGNGGVGGVSQVGKYLAYGGGGGAIYGGGAGSKGRLNQSGVTGMIKNNESAESGGVQRLNDPNQILGFTGADGTVYSGTRAGSGGPSPSDAEPGKLTGAAGFIRYKAGRGGLGASYYYDNNWEQWRGEGSTAGEMGAGGGGGNGKPIDQLSASRGGHGKVVISW